MQRKDKQRTKSKESKLVPSALQESRVKDKISECLATGMAWKDAEAALLAWNAAQPSPMKVSKLKAETYHAYHSATSAKDSTHS